MTLSFIRFCLADVLFCFFSLQLLCSFHITVRSVWWLQLVPTALCAIILITAIPLDILGGSVRAANPGSAAPSCDAGAAEATSEAQRRIRNCRDGEWCSAQTHCIYLSVHACAGFPNVPVSQQWLMALSELIDTNWFAESGLCQLSELIIRLFYA